jgi:hypothetical protein
VQNFATQKNTLLFSSICYSRLAIPHEIFINCTWFFNPHVKFIIFQMDDMKGGLSPFLDKELPRESISWATLGDEFAMSCIRIASFM